MAGNFKSIILGLLLIVLHEIHLIRLENYEAKWGCDFIGNDFWKTKTFSPEKCSKTCLSNRECTHFTYTPDGVCWLKTGQVSAEQAISSQNKQTICGIVFKDEKKKKSCKSLENDKIKSYSSSNSLEDIISSNLINNEFIITSIANKGYEEMTLNWILSLKKVNIDKFLILCLDQDLFNFLAHKGYMDNLFMVPSDWHQFKLTQYLVVWNTKEFDAIMHARTQIIHKLLNLNVTLLFADSDIVWLNQNVLEHVQFIFQQTSVDVLFSISEVNKRKVWYCMGFYYVKPTAFTIKLFADLIEYQRQKPHISDEDLLNSMIDLRYKKTDKIGILDPILFPSGNVWLERKLDVKFQITPYILHANFLIGKQSKIDAFKNKNLWFLEEEECTVNTKKSDL